MVSIRDLKPVARQRVTPGRAWWVGGLTQHRGHPLLPDADGCQHRHASRAEARECAELMLHCDDGSLLAEQLTRALA